MIWIGLTGPMACGKSSVARILSRYSIFKVIDADYLAREALTASSPLIPQLIQRWGDQILDENLNVNRMKVGDIIFNQSVEKKWLESLIHPLVKSQVEIEKTKAQEQGCIAAFYDVPLLFETNMQAEFDAIVLVACHKESQIKRSIERDSLTVTQIESRLANQISLDQKIIGSQYIIWNNDPQTWAELEAEVNKLKDWILSRAQS